MQVPTQTFLWYLHRREIDRTWAEISGHLHDAPVQLRGVARRKMIEMPGQAQRMITLNAPWPVRAAATVRNAWKGLWA